MKGLIVSFLLFICIQINYSQSVDSLMQAYLKDSKFATTVIVLKKDSVVFNKSYGFENIEQQKKASDKTLYHLENVSEQITAVAVLYLAQQEKLNLNDKLSKWFKGLQNGADSINVLQLLSHTTGLKSPIEHIMDKDYSKLNSSSVQALINGSKILDQKVYSYDPVNYAILRYVIEKASGKKYQKYLQKLIFKPIGVKAYLYDGKKNKGIRSAVGYKMGESGMETINLLDNSYLIGHNGIFMNADNYLKWQIALNKKKVLNKEYFKYLKQPTRIKELKSSKDIAGWKPDLNNYRLFYYKAAIGFGATAYVKKQYNDKFELIIFSNGTALFGLRKLGFQILKLHTRYVYYEKM